MSPPLPLRFLLLFLRFRHWPRGKISIKRHTASSAVTVAFTSSSLYVSIFLVSFRDQILRFHFLLVIFGADWSLQFCDGSPRGDAGDDDALGSWHRHSFKRALPELLKKLLFSQKYASHGLNVVLVKTEKSQTGF